MAEFVFLSICVVLMVVAGTDIGDAIADRIRGRKKDG